MQRGVLVAACLAVGGIDLAWINLSLGPAVLGGVSRPVADAAEVRHAEGPLDAAVAAVERDELAPSAAKAAVVIPAVAPAEDLQAPAGEPEPAIEPPEAVEPEEALARGGDEPEPAPVPAEGEPEPPIVRAEGEAEPEDGATPVAMAPSARSVAGSRVQLASITFDATGRAGLTRRMRAELRRVVDALQDSAPAKIHVRGHTDHRGPAEINRELSATRARAVTEFLIARGIDPARIHTEGLGADEPVAQGDSPRDLRRNRRVEILVGEAE